MPNYERSSTLDLSFADLEDSYSPVPSLEDSGSTKEAATTLPEVAIKAAIPLQPRKEHLSTDQLFAPANLLGYEESGSSTWE